VEKSMKTLRIAMVAPCPFPTSQGTQVFIGQLVQALRKRGHRIHLLTYHYGDTSLEFPGPVRRSWRLPISHKLDSGPSPQKPIFDMLLAIQLNKLVQEEKIQIIHAHNYEGMLVGLMIRRLRKVPLVFHTHNTMTHELPSYSRSPWGQHMARWLARLLDRQLPGRADACIAVSPDIAAFIRLHGVSSNKVWTIPPAIEAHQFEIEGRPAQEEKRGGARLLYAGNLDAYQNFSLILESLPEVLAHYPQCSLEVVTNSSPGRSLEQAERMGLRERVHFTQTTSFGLMRDLLTKCDLALCPRISPYGFPIKLLNYLAAGKPVVICQGSANGIQHLVTGWVVRDEDAHAFARAIVSLLDKPGLRRKLSENARRMVRERYSWEQWVPRYEEIYQKTLQNWRTPS
jgi:glycosyltransferase involved in cell wall biosynthesis